MHTRAMTQVNKVGVSVLFINRILS